MTRTDSPELEHLIPRYAELVDDGNVAADACLYVTVLQALPGDVSKHLRS